MKLAQVWTKLDSKSVEWNCCAEIFHIVGSFDLIMLFMEELVDLVYG